MAGKNCSCALASRYPIQLTKIAGFYAFFHPTSQSGHACEQVAASIVFFEAVGR